MRTVTDATLYVVKGPRGSYYAIRENETGMVLTERTEHAAATLASSKDMIIVDRLEITHEQLLAMTASSSHSLAANGASWSAETPFGAEAAR